MSQGRPTHPPLRGRGWTREELRLALNLYHKLSFGQLRHGNPVVIDLARRMGRTPDSVSGLKAIYIEFTHLYSTCRINR